MMTKKGTDGMDTSFGGCAREEGNKRGGREGERTRKGENGRGGERQGGGRGTFPLFYFNI